jgi:hypothetical protein
MVNTRIIAGVLVGALGAAPAFAAADEGQRRGQRREAQQEGHAVPRSAAGQGGGERRQAEAQPRSQPPANLSQRQYQAQAGPNQVQGQVQPQYSSQRSYQAQRQYDRQPAYQAPRYDNHAYVNGGYDNRYVGRAVPRPYYSYSNRGYGARTIIVPRIVHPSVVTVIPYRPYVYRPSIGPGVYYGFGGAYPYGYTPRGYYDPYPGRPYGGLRIIDAPRDAQVFADGYYIGLVDDFDGVFQHANLEAGAHRIEVVPPGYEPIAFDVMIQPDRTITYRVNLY